MPVTISSGSARNGGKKSLPGLFQNWAGLAWRLGMINRAHAWYTDLQRYPQPYQAQYAYTVPGWLNDFIETMQMPPEEHP